MIKKIRLSVHQQDWANSKSDERISSFIFFLRGRGIELLRKLQDAEESTKGRILEIFKLAII